MVLNSGADFSNWMETCSLDPKKAATLLNLPEPFVHYILKDEIKISLNIKDKCYKVIKSL